jgi:hypothetical protein
MYRFILEPYRSGGSNRYRCPSCGKKREFTRYIDTETGRYLSHNVGMCNRRSECGYHYPPAEFFQDHPEHRVVDSVLRSSSVRRSARNQFDKPREFDTIPVAILKNSISNTRANAFFDFLNRTFGPERAVEARRRYYIGTWKDGRTVFWQVDKAGKIRTGKLMAYDAFTGKRRKNRDPSWVHAELKSSLTNGNRTFSLSQCMFGEHLLGRSSGPVAVVESEKTAIIMSIIHPGRVWLATGGCMNLKSESLRSIISNGREIALFPDSTQFQKWSAIADRLGRNMGMNVKVSDLLERSLSPEQIAKDIDLADVVISAMRREHRDE